MESQIVVCSAVVAARESEQCSAIAREIGSLTANVSQHDVRVHRQRDS
jgi:hypothetical protein